MTEHTAEHHDDHGVHVVPLKILVGVWAILVVGTILTYAATYIDLGGTVNLLIAIAIATVKASFVCLYFMHLRWDHKFLSVVFISTLLFVGLFIFIAMMDSGEYQQDIVPMKAAPPAVE